VGRPLRLRDMGGSKRGGVHGAVAREKGEAALGRCEEEEGRVPRGPEGLVGWLAAWGREGLDGLGRPAGQGRGSGQAGWAEWAEFGGRILFE
jgi:hypothetical protein